MYVIYYFYRVLKELQLGEKKLGTIIIIRKTKTPKKSDKKPPTPTPAADPVSVLLKLQGKEGN